MNSFRGSLFQAYRSLHTISRDGRPSEYLKKRIAEIDKKRKRKDVRKHQVFVQVSHSKAWLDTASWPQIFSVLATGIACKLWMMWEDSRSQEKIEQKILADEDEGVGSVRMLTREEWDAAQEVWPRTPFESSWARPNARIRTGEKLSWQDVKDWSIDMVTDGLTRTEETAKRGSNKPGS